MSHAVSRGRLAPLVDRKFVVVGLVCNHFTHTQDHDCVLYWCGVYLALCGRLVLFCYHQKRENEEKSG